MTSLALATVLQASITTLGGDSYAEAYRAATKTRRPMLVMVSAEWCGPCQRMKKTVLPQVRKRGLLKQVAFAIVNVDRQRVLSRKLIGRGPVPQLVMFRRAPKGWVRRKLVGGQNVKTVEKFISQGVAPEKADKRAPGKGKKDHRAQKHRTAAKRAEKAEVRPASKS